MRFLTLSVTGLVAVVLPVTAKPAKKTQSARVDAKTPQEQLAGFTVPEGYVVELVASEADGLINPIDIAFDDAGRMWTETARMYPLDPVAKLSFLDIQRLMGDPEQQKKIPEFKRILDLYEGRTKGEDEVLVISDLYGGGKAKVSVFADGLAIPQSVLPYKNGVFVAQGSELFFLNDTNGDGKADKRVPVLTGFGFTDTHTMAHTLVRGPGNWVHFSQGALNKGEVTAVRSGAKARFDFSKIGRFSMDGNKIEVIGCGLNNIWGFWMRSNGQWWGTEANDKGFSITPMEPGTGIHGIGSARLRPYQPFLPTLHQFRVGGTGISGVAYSDDESGGFPEKWKDVAFLANPITSKINAVRIVREADGRVTAEHLEDFLTCEDDWFRPVNMEFGPDGCLYVADWYNKIVSHNEVDRDHPDRDKKHGRIWRVRYVGQEAREVPDLYKASPEDLVKHLSAPSAWEKRAAVNQIGDRDLKQLAAPLVKLAGDTSATEVTRIHALWALEGIGHYDASLMDGLLKVKLEDLRREAVRSLAILAPDLAQFNRSLASLVDDPNPMVRSQVLRTIAERGEANGDTIDLLVTACRPEIPGNELGGPYERKFERFLARVALEQYASELDEYLGGEAALKQPGSHLLWASQALPEKERNRAFLKLWASKSGEGPVDESTFVSIAGMLGSPEIFKAVGPDLQDPNYGPQYVVMALKNQADVQSPQLAKVFAPVVARMLGDEAWVDQGLQAVARLKVPVDSATLVGLLKGSPSERRAAAVLAALAADPKANQKTLAELAATETLPLKTQLVAVKSLMMVSPPAGKKRLGDLLAKLSDDQKKELVVELSSARPAAPMLVEAHVAGSLPTSAFDLSSAERILQANKKDGRAKKLLAQVRKMEEADKARFNQRLAHLMEVPEKLKGDPAKGKGLFATCLLCHRVGDEGFEIAPSLDGSAHREREALLTAIINPDAAVEGGYQIFRVAKKDGSVVEGYRIRDDERGVTLAFMGGANVFIPTAEIAAKNFVLGRSFMPKGLIDAYQDQDVADLLAYILTLK